MPVSGATKIKLSDVKAVGMEMDPDTDAIQLLDPETTKTQALYTYVTEELAKEWDLEEGSVGWWDKGAYGPDFESRNDVDIDVGRGFLLLNAFGHNIQFTCAGAVPTMSTSYTTSGKKALVATYMPTDMTLGDIVIPGLDIDPDTDAIQVLDPNTTKTKALYTYVSAELAEEWDLEEGSVGWWDKGAYGPDFESRNNVAVKSGDTFLLLNAKGHTFNFQYKSALDVTKPTEE